MQVESNASRPIDTGGADPGGASAVAAAARLRQQLPFVRRDAHAIEPSPRKGSLLSLVGRRHLRVFARAHERHAALTGAAGSPRWLSALSRLRFGGSSFLSRLRRATGSAHTPSAQATSGPTATGAAASADTQALERLTSSLQQRFAARAADRQGFHALLAQAFGDGYDTARAETIRLQTLAGDFSWMPSIRVADARALTDTSGTQGEGVVLGAYVADTDTIYVSRELLGDAERAGRLLTEELGHALDARLNARDAAGDEGEIFSRLVHDGQLDASELAALRAENDHGLVTIDGRSVSVEYGFFSKIKRALKKGIKSVTKSIVKGAVDLTRGSLQMTNGALTLNLDRVREGAKTSADAVQDTGKAVFKAVKETDKELRAIAKEALHKLMQSKWFAVVLTICRFIPIPVVQLVVRVIDLVRAAYMIYQGAKNRSLSAVFSGVASLAGGAGQLAGALGASATTVSTIGSVATAASNLSMAYNAVAQKDLGAALGLLAGQAGQAGAPGAVAGYAQYAQQAYGVARAARDGDVLGAIGNGLSLAGSGVDGADPALAQLGDVVTGLRVAQQIERGNLDAAHGLASSMQVAQQARSEADSLAAQQRAQVTQDDIGGELAPEHVTQDSFGEMSEAPAGDSGASAAAPEAALPDAQPAGPPTFTVEAGQTLEGIARSRYGDQWRAGVTQLILENQIALNQWGSPVLRVGQGLTASDLPLDSQRLDALARAGGSIVANNSRGLAERAGRSEAIDAADAQGSGLKPMQAGEWYVGTAERARVPHEDAHLVPNVPDGTDQVSYAAWPEPDTSSSAGTSTAGEYDALGNYVGTVQMVDASLTMSYGEQMRNVGRFATDIGIGAVKGLDNLLPETAATLYRMTGYASAGAVSLFDTEVSDRMFAQYERVTGRIFEYDNSAQALGGFASQLAMPSIFKGVGSGGSAMYRLEQTGKEWINYNARHHFSGKITLESERTFYSYKNSNYLKPDLTYDNLQLWVTPERLTSSDAIRRLALPHGSGYDTLLTVTLPKGTEIVTPRPVWSLYGRAGGGIETRIYSPVTPSMYRIGPPPH